MRFSLFTSAALLLATASVSGAAPVPKSNPADILAIRDTISVYALTVDAQKFDNLDNVFTQDVKGDFALPTGSVSGIAAVKSALSGALTGLSSYHAMSTTTVDITGKNTAKSTAYFTATFFGQGDLSGQTAVAYGRYEDTWTKDGKESWLISERNLIYMAPIIGNAAILSGGS
ncbi:MAG: hypothetical protein M1817_002602 [Caeruleum heppii]|nr:MAG: hypothetical protein M1817_002602 [Caeruleum heppii]